MKKKQIENQPKASRPDMPGYGIVDAKSGAGLLPWKWAETRLSRARQYLLITVRRDGRPHAMPIWGIWLDGAFYFSTGKTSVKARNLAQNPNCIVCPDTGEEVVIVEGVATVVSQQATLKKFTREYLAKYDFDISTMSEPIFVVRLVVAFGQIEKTFTESATRWVFPRKSRRIGH